MAAPSPAAASPAALAALGRGRQELALAWGAAANADFGPLLALAGSAALALLPLDGGGGPLADPVEVTMLQESCQRAAAAAVRDAEASEALPRLAAVLRSRFANARVRGDGAGPAQDLMRPALSELVLGAGGQTARGVLAALFEADPALLQTSVRRPGLDKTVLEAALMRDDGPLVELLLRRWPGPLLDRVRMKLGGENGPFVAMVKQAMDAGAVDAFKALRAFSLEPAAAALGVEPLRVRACAQLLYGAGREAGFLALLQVDPGAIGAMHCGPALELPYRIAIRRGFAGAAQALRHGGYACDAVFAAIDHEAASVEMLNEALEAPTADVNARQPDDGGSRPLLAAAKSGRLDLLQRLLEAGADPDLTDDAGRNTLTVAKRAIRPQLKALLAARAARRAMLACVGAVPKSAPGGPQQGRPR